jgi:NAD(P)-dependent dehydrogenase (short-subunit alcohol dehydrogenase family)
MFPILPSPGLIEMADDGDMREGANASSNRIAIVLGVTGDIGREIARRLLADGWLVIGLGRSADRLDRVADRPEFRFISCDLSSRQSILEAIETFKLTGASWDLFVSAAGTMEPIGPFFSLDFDRWEQSVIANATAQLRVLHGLWPNRRPGGVVDVMLMAGGGTNNPFPNYSAYCVSKIALIKMCELIDDEEPNVNAFIIGPGFVKTRIHDETLRAKAEAGENYRRTLDFLETPGTSFDDIYAHMLWCMSAGRRAAGGRNFSTVHDFWRDGGERLLEKLPNDPDAFRLRRRNPGSPP